jgi:hypothetical protein
LEGFSGRLAMKFRDAIGFSLQLVLPDKAILAFERFLQPPRPGSSLGAPPPAGARPDSVVRTNSDSLWLIKELDSAQFGGPSFGEQSISMMAKALDDALTMLPSPIENSKMRELAQKILDHAADGERNPVRLRQAALGNLIGPESEPGR